MRSYRLGASWGRSCVVRQFAALLTLSLAVISQPASARKPCLMGDADASWLTQALAQWRASARDDLGIRELSLPTVYVLDAQCLYEIESGDVAHPRAATHGGAPELPDGQRLPLGPVSFAFGKDRFVMSLPSVWREAGVTSEYGLERLMTGVLLHEIMHTLQSDLAEQFLDPIGREHGIGDELSDDLLQHRFADVPGYEAAYREEAAALFAAAAATSDSAAREHAAHALHLMRRRRAQWFTGDEAYFVELDDIFLTMEGLGQWLIYRYFQQVETEQGGPGRALEATRRGGRWWSQDEGLALMLVVDRLHPDWREHIFTDPGWRAQNLLSAAAGQ